MEHNFTHGPADDGIHDDIQFNEYVPDSTMWVTARQFIIGTLEVLALAAMYGLFGMLEG